MTNMKIAGNALVITSEIKAEDMYLLNNRSTMTDEEGNVVYRLEYDPTAKLSSINANGILFSKKNKQGYLQLTVLVNDPDVENIKKMYADAIINFKLAEQATLDALNQRKQLIDETFATLQVEE